MALDYCEAKRFIDTLPWPTGMRPLLRMGQVVERPSGKVGYVALLYRADNLQRNVQATGPAPEGALLVALMNWIDDHGLPVEMKFRLAKLFH